MHPLSLMQTGVSHNSRYATRYFHGSYRIFTPTLYITYRPTVVPVDHNPSVHVTFQHRPAR